MKLLMEKSKIMYKEKSQKGEKSSSCLDALVGRSSVIWHWCWRHNDVCQFWLQLVQGFGFWQAQSLLLPKGMQYCNNTTLQKFTATAACDMTRGEIRTHVHMFGFGMVRWVHQLPFVVFVRFCNLYCILHSFWFVIEINFYFTNRRTCCAVRYQCNYGIKMLLCPY